MKKVKFGPPVESLCPPFLYYWSDLTETISDAPDKYTRKMEDKLNNFLRKIRNCIDIPSDVFKGLFASGSAPGILYGLHKIHKTDFHSKFQFQPIFAAYNSPFFNIAKFRRVSKGGAFGARAPPLSLMPNEKIYGD